MSQLNLKGLVATIKGTTAYAPVIEAIRNAIYTMVRLLLLYTVAVIL